MKLDKIIGKLLLTVFLFSIVSTFVFWTFLSDLKGVDEETEKAFAEILNTKFQSGDIIFPEIDWDLGFLKYLNPGIMPVYLTLKETTEKEIQYMKDDGGKIFFLLKTTENWEKISKRTGVTEIERIHAGKGIVIIGSDGTEELRKPFVFTRDIGNALKVWFSKGTEIFPCQKSSVNRWQCSNDEWNYVGTTSAVMNGKQQKAVWAHPKSNMTLHIQFELSRKIHKLTFNSALLESAYRSENNSPVQVEILADGNSLLKYENKSERKTYSSTIDLSKEYSILELRFATENDGQRHFVFNGHTAE